MTTTATPKPTDVSAKPAEPVNRAGFAPKTPPDLVIPTNLPRTPAPLFRLGISLFDVFRRDVIGRLAHIGKTLGDVTSILERIYTRIPAPAKTNTFAEAVTVYEWKVAPGSIQTTSWQTADEIIEPGPGLVADIVQRVDTITAMGDLCSMTFNRQSGKLGIHARKRLT